MAARIHRFNFRADEYLADLIRRAVDLSGEEMSEWLRSRTEANANHEIHQATQRHENRPLTLGMSLVRRPEHGCAHPVQAREKVGTVVMCRACSTPIGSLL